MSRHVLDFGTLEFRSNCAIGKIDEGIQYELEHAEQLLQLVKTHFGDQPFVYIAHRINSYSVDPMIYRLFNQQANLAAFVFAVAPQRKNTVDVEKLFLNDVPTHYCTDLSQALDWARQFSKAA